VSEPDFAERLRAEHPEHFARWDRLLDELLHPLRQLICPHEGCGVRFGMESDELRFAEQTGQPVYCPRGHRVMAVIR
jgi:hypothetical protein